MGFTCLQEISEQFYQQKFLLLCCTQKMSYFPQSKIQVQTEFKNLCGSSAADWVQKKLPMLCCSSRGLSCSSTTLVIKKNCRLRRNVSDSWSWSPFFLLLLCNSSCLLKVSCCCPNQCFIVSFFQTFSPVFPGVLFSFFCYIFFFHLIFSGLVAVFFCFTLFRRVP